MCLNLTKTKTKHSINMSEPQKADLIADLQSDTAFKEDLAVLINFIGGKKKVADFARKVRENQVPVLVKNLLR